ncbi:unnamed protein product [Victoria cruziana]
MCGRPEISPSSHRHGRLCVVPAPEHRRMRDEKPRHPSIQVISENAAVLVPREGKQKTVVRRQAAHEDGYRRRDSPPRWKWGCTRTLILPPL